MKNKKLLPQLIFTILWMMTLNIYSQAQSYKTISVKFGKNNAVNDVKRVDTVRVGTCEGTGLCQASSEPVKTFAKVELVVEKNVALRDDSYILTMQIWRRKLRNSKAHKSKFKEGKYTFEEDTRVAVSLINGSGLPTIGYAVIPKGTYGVIKHFLGHFELVISNVTFVEK